MTNDILEEIRNQNERNGRTLESINSRLDTISSAVIVCAIVSCLFFYKFFF